MKKKWLIAMSILVLGLVGCGPEKEEETGSLLEPIPATEAATEAEAAAVAESIPDEQPAAEAGSTAEAEQAEITQDQALDAIKKYCFEQIPDLEDMMKSDDYTIYFDVSTTDAGEIVVLFRSYTAAQIRYYVDPATGEVYVTELVPGIIDEEQRTDESFNIKDYMD